MVQSIKYKLSGYLLNNDDRSKRILKNTIMSFGVKGASILIGLLLVPMTINYINPIQYGLWLTISSIVSWMNFFDIGLGNGLRNKLATAIAHNNYDDAKIYVSTTYGILSLISIILFVSFWFINPYINWKEFLNIPLSITDNISRIILIVFCSFCGQFVVQTVNTVLIASHESAKAGLVSLTGQFLILVSIIILKYLIPGSLSVLVWTLTGMPIVTLIIASIYLYNTKLKNICPDIKKIDFKYAGSILNTGGVFFIIQIGAIILFQTSNIIINKFIGASAVTEFNIVYKLFSVIILGFNIIMTPYWSAFTDAYAKKDFIWMKETLIKIRKLWILISLIIVPLLCTFSDKIYMLWIGQGIKISPLLSMSMAFYVIGYTGMMLNCYFLNGIGKLRIQLLLYLIVCVINIPLSIYFGKNYGTIGITNSNVLMFLIMSIILWIQSSKIVNEKAKGIWNK